MPSLNKKNLIIFIVTAFIVASIPVGIFLVNNRAVFNPQAADSNRSLYAKNVLVLKYFPLTTDGQNINSAVTGDVSEPYSVIKNKTNEITTNLLQSIAKATAYRGYQNSAAIPAVQMSVIDTKEYTQPVPIKAKGVRTSYPDYSKIMNDHDICNMVNNQNVREVWIYAYQGPNNPQTGRPYLDIDESKMAGPFGDISNSFRYNDMPVCNYSYRVLTFNYGRGTGEAFHSWGHQIEAEMNAVDFVTFGLFQGPPHPQANNQDGRCGSVHNPPNARFEYDYENPTPWRSDCLDWNPNNMGTFTQISCNTWSPGCSNNTHSRTDSNNPQLNYLIWNWQNLPGFGNTKTYQGKQFRNLWDIYGDFDRVMAADKTFFLAPPSPSPNTRYLNITSPVGGESWEVGTVQNITWQSNNTGSCYLTVVGVSGTLTLTYLSPEAMASQKYEWRISPTFPDQFKLKARIVCSTYGMTDLVAESPNQFTITRPPVLTADDDKDGFNNGVELLMGTQPSRACSQSASDSAWPVDTNNSTGINGGDVSKIVPFVSGLKAYDKRYDLNLDGVIDKNDIETIVKYFLQECTAIDPQATPNPSVLAMYDIPNVADLNKNRKVDIFDFNQLITDFAKKGTGIVSDINKDEIVNIFDFNIMITNFGRTY